jgi:hypothetical protein
MKGFYVVDDKGAPQHVNINHAYHGPCDICGGEYSHWDAADVEEVSFFETREKAEYYCGYSGDEVKQITLGEEKV